MLYGEVIAVCSQIYTEHTDTLCGQDAELLNVKPGGTYSNHRRDNDNRFDWANVKIMRPYLQSI
jgi:RecB family endonuclease NucS